MRKDDVTVELNAGELSVHGEVKERERTGVLRHRTRRTGRFDHRVTLSRDTDEKTSRPSSPTACSRWKSPRPGRPSPGASRSPADRSRTYWPGGAGRAKHARTRQVPRSPPGRGRTSGGQGSRDRGFRRSREARLLRAAGEGPSPTTTLGRSRAVPATSRPRASHRRRGPATAELLSPSWSGPVPPVGRPVIAHRRLLQATRVAKAEPFVVNLAALGLQRLWSCGSRGSPGRE
ncbi:hypothetical protein [Streptomyces sp. enrichment culture]|uniref:Hsp20/alpha crystallin family protein n=1 Tax=Streptomyces sp. enrichment culture TaxID=1795815 RepID=UPI003F563192